MFLQVSFEQQLELQYQHSEHNLHMETSELSSSLRVLFFRTRHNSKSRMKV